MNGLLPFERTIEQTTETIPPSPKTITAVNNEENYKLRRVTTLLNFLSLFDSMCKLLQSQIVFGSNQGI